MLNPFWYSAAPPGGDPYYDDTVLILNGDGTNNSTTAIDSSPAARTMTAFGNAKLSTTDPKFGTASLLFDGADDSFRASASADFNFGTADFTAEWWVKFASVSSLQFFFMVGSNNVSLQNGTALKVRAGNDFPIDTTITAPAASTWHHMALTRAGTSWVFYINGTSVATGTSSAAFGASGSTLYVGSNFEGGFSLNGRMEIRLTKALRYTSAFTPPTEAFATS